MWKTIIVLVVACSTMCEMAIAAQKKSRLAILDLEAHGMESPMAMRPAEVLKDYLTKYGAYEIVGKEAIEFAARTKGFDPSNFARDANKVKSIAEALKLTWIVSGKVGRISSLYLASLQILNVDKPEKSRVFAYRTAESIESVLQMFAADLTAYLTQVDAAKQYKQAKGYWRARLYFDVYYQLLGLSDKFWNQQFGNTPFENYHEGVGGYLGFGVPLFRVGVSGHNMLNRNLAKTTPKFSGAGYQAHAIINIPLLRPFGLDIGGGYYWLDYTMTDQANKTSSWKNEGALVIGGFNIGTLGFKLFGEGNFAVRQNNKTIDFAYIRGGLRFAFPLKSK